MDFFLLSAVEFLRNAPEGTYDAIIVDSSDPIGELMLLCLLVFMCSVHFGILASYIYYS